MTRTDANPPARRRQAGAAEPAERPGVRPTGVTSDPFDAVDDSSRPPRPQMERTPAPASPALVRPRIVGLVLGLYYGGLGAGAVGVISALLWRTGAKENLLSMMAESTVDDASKQQVADLVLYGAIGVVVLLLFIQLALVVRLAGARPGARPGLGLVVVAQVLLYTFAADIVRTTGWEAIVVQVGLAVQAAAGVVASVLSWLPAVGRWLGGRSAARRK